MRNKDLNKMVEEITTTEILLITTSIQRDGIQVRIKADSKFKNLMSKTDVRKFDDLIEEIVELMNDMFNKSPEIVRYVAKVDLLDEMKNEEINQKIVNFQDELIGLLKDLNKENN